MKYIKVPQHVLTKRLGIQPGSVSEVIEKLEKVSTDWEQRYQDIAEKRKHCCEGHGQHGREKHIERRE